MDDGKIVELYFAKDQSAITETSLKYGNPLRRIAYNILNNHSNVEECENDTYLSAWNSIPPANPATYLFAFLARIIRNYSLDLCRKQKAQKRNAVVIELSSELEQCIPFPSDNESELSCDEISDLIGNFLHFLKQEERKIFIKRYWYCDKISQIANECDCSESKVKSMLFRARNKLKNYLQKEGVEL